MFQILPTLCQLRLLLGLVVFHFYRHAQQFFLRFRVTHHESHIDQRFHRIRISDGNKHPFVVLLTTLQPITTIFGQSHGTSRMFCHNRTDNTGNQNHNDHPIQHTFIHQELTGRYLYLSSHHHHRQSSGCMGITQTKQHLTSRFRHPEHQLCEPCRQPFGSRSHQYHDQYYPKGFHSMKQGSQIDKHPYPNQEIWDEQGIAHKLHTIHQRRDMRNERIQHQTCHKSTKDAFQTHQLCQCSTQEHQSQYKDVLHYIVLISTEKPTGKTGKHNENKGTISQTLGSKQNPSTRIHSPFIHARNTR